MKDESHWQWKQEKKEKHGNAFVNNESWMSNDERWMTSDEGWMINDKWWMILSILLSHSLTNSFCHTFSVTLTHIIT